MKKGQLVKMLDLYDDEDEVILYVVGMTTEMSWEAELDLEEDTVDKHNGRIRISFGNF